MPGLFVPHFETQAGGIQLMSGTTVRYAWTFRAPKAGTLNRGAVRFLNVATPQTMKASFQSPFASVMRPDETVDQFRTFTPVSNSLITTGLITSDGTDGGVKRVVTKGELLCFVVEWDSATGSAQLQAYGVLNEHWKPNVWHAIRSSAGTWTIPANAATGIFAVEYETGGWAQIDGAFVASADATHVFNSGSSPDEIGVRFLAPFSGAVLRGVHGRWNINGACELRLYDAAGALLDSAVIDQLARSFASTTGHYVELGGEVALVGGAEYRVALQPTTGTSITLPYIDVPSNDYLATHAMGLNCYQSSRTNAGAWTNLATRLPLMNLIWRDAVPPETAEVIFNPDDLTPVGLVWVEAFLPT